MENILLLLLLGIYVTWLKLQFWKVFVWTKHQNFCLLALVLTFQSKRTTRKQYKFKTFSNEFYWLLSHSSYPRLFYTATNTLSALFVLYPLTPLHESKLTTYTVLIVKQPTLPNKLNYRLNAPARRLVFVETVRCLPSLTHADDASHQKDTH